MSIRLIGVILVGGLSVLSATFGGTSPAAATSPELPTSMDWRTATPDHPAVVRGVFNQQRCVDSEGFARAAVLESFQTLEDGTTPSYGYLEQTFDDPVHRPALAADPTCLVFTVFPNTDNPPTGYVRDWVNLESGNEAALLEAVATKGPVRVVVNACSRTLQYYKTGIYTDTSEVCDRVEHSMVVVGYGTENGVDYWIVRNSFGRFWGEDGYLRIQRGNNTVGIADSAAYPVLH